MMIVVVFILLAWVSFCVGFSSHRFSTPITSITLQNAIHSTATSSRKTETLESFVVNVEHSLQISLGKSNIQKYTHNSDIRSRISAANKGKQPWNVGMNHSEETKRKISAGVRERIRVDIERNATALGLSVEEYELRKLTDKRERIKLRRSTNRKSQEELNLIRSEIMRKRWQDPVYREKYTRGKVNKPSNETRQKIAQKIRELWASGYYSNVSKNANAKRLNRRGPKVFHGNVSSGLTETSLKRRPRSEEWRHKISEIIKSKWEDPSYRANVVEGIRRNKRSSTSNSYNFQPSSRKTVTSKLSSAVDTVHKEAAVDETNANSVLEEAVKSTRKHRKVILFHFMNSR